MATASENTKISAKILRLDSVYKKAIDVASNSLNNADLDECFQDLKSQYGNVLPKLFMNMIAKSQVNIEVRSHFNALVIFLSHNSPLTDDGPYRPPTKTLVSCGTSKNACGHTRPLPQVLALLRPTQSKIRLLHWWCLMEAICQQKPYWLVIRINRHCTVSESIGSYLLSISLFLIDREMDLSTAEDPLSPTVLLELKRAEAEGLREAIHLVSTARTSYSLSLLCDKNVVHGDTVCNRWALLMCVCLHTSRLYQPYINCS